MKAEDAIAQADAIPVGVAARLMHVHPNTVRNQLKSGHLVGWQIGREWIIPVLYDEQDRPVFFHRYPDGDGGE
jgi:hypothetical protein